EDENSNEHHNVGNCYESCIDVPEDEKKAFDWYLESADGGSSDGQLNVGNCYLNGIGVSKNEKKAFEWYLKAARGGNSDGQLNVGNCSRNAVGGGFHFEDMLLCFYKLIVPIFVELECSLGSVIQIACLFSHLSFDVPTRRMGEVCFVFFKNFFSFSPSELKQIKIIIKEETLFFVSMMIILSVFEAHIYKFET
ncbi:hypothetical protein C2G38_1979536, partial [Gigaspora rosea]